VEEVNRKHTWVHITYEQNGNIGVHFVTDYWERGSYLRRHKRLIEVNRLNYTRMACLLRVLSYSANVRYTIFSWNGYSVSYERRKKS